MLSDKVRSELNKQISVEFHSALAAGVRYSSFGLLLSPIIVGATMSLSSVSLIGNALCLRRVML